MRIISGEAKGRVLKTREGKGTRPTDARAREMLFNILGGRVIGARFLDLYAGNGSVGLEALSRGADFCIFIEQNIAATQAIRQNLKVFGWTDRAQVWHTTVKAALRRMQELQGNPAEAGQAIFDIVFADPPFTNMRELPDLALRLDNVPAIVKPNGGLLVVQHHRKAEFKAANFELQQQRRAGESCLTFAVPRAAPEAANEAVEPNSA